MRLQVRICELSVYIWFCVFTLLAVALLLLTSFVDRFLKVTFPNERTIVPAACRPAPMLTVHVQDETKRITRRGKRCRGKTNPEVLFHASPPTSIQPNCRQPYWSTERECPHVRGLPRVCGEQVPGNGGYRIVDVLQTHLLKPLVVIFAHAQ